ncbi:nucleotidyltransferase domain-containing protein [Ktedonobacter robiniae]|uniref:Aminoglycoside adenylyltransferase n=1 Tax=Ktedonobacter robiniae TaxID=2778365 RepID=A0ABQ3V200_9CHLR|nr:hypothetical protein [Ktedonobacter robiniae]GHO59179.1 hypothetical protein KSB_76540 [Ktedonobacter robiniae]
MNSRQLILLQEILTLCETKAISIWVRGGWAVDFALGQITREHEDIDLFAWAKDAERLVETLEQAGFSLQQGPPPEAQRDFTKDEESIQVALVGLNETGELIVAGGPAAGSLWPQGMLGSHRGQIGETVCLIVNPLVQIELKEQYPVWRPDLPHLPKHADDIARLRERFIIQ